MPVLQWGMLCVLSLLLSIGFLAVHLPAALLLGPMIAGIIFSMRGITLQLPRSAFLAAQAILGCMIAQNLTGSILTTLAANWPIVLAILLVTLLSSAIVGWLLVRYSSLPGNTGAWGSSPGGAAAMVAMAQDYGADIRLVAFMQYLRVLFVAGAAVLVTRMMLGDNAEAVNQQIVWFPPVSINLLLTILLAVVAGTAGCMLRLPSGTMLIPMLAGAVLQSGQLITIELPEWLLAMAYMAIGWRIGLGFDKQ
ncbi:AbrB family transcriptional regulator, partial [Shigella sonnei]